ncbi:MAG: (2Fe-2S) ferredoxin domain-containing protein [Planctomycetota bacterium]|nr:(2Fe-2S) ferredoxin domain-containing protein [Planctomycetota bacterium]
MGKKIKSVEDLNAIRDGARKGLDLRVSAREMQVTVHMGTCGIAAGAREVLLAIASELGEEGSSKVLLRQAGCAGLCDREPMITVVDKSGVEYRYGKLDGAKAREIVREHILGGRPVAALLIR